MHLPPLNAYQFNYSNVDLANNPNHYFKAVHTYKFTADTNTPYLVIVEEYEHHVYIFSFCLENHKNNNDKFNILTHKGAKEARRVISTCVQIGLSIYEKNPLASFGFVASPTTDELSKTGSNRTKRLFVYQRFAQLFFHPENFIYSLTEEQSSYLILNKKYKQQEPDALQKITAMLKRDLLSVVNNHS